MTFNRTSKRNSPMSTNPHAPPPPNFSFLTPSDPTAIVLHSHPSATFPPTLLSPRNLVFEWLENWILEFFSGSKTGFLSFWMRFWVTQKLGFWVFEWFENWIFQFLSGSETGFWLFERLSNWFSEFLNDSKTEFSSFTSPHYTIIHTVSPMSSNPHATSKFFIPYTSRPHRYFLLSSHPQTQTPPIRHISTDIAGPAEPCFWVTWKLYFWVFEWLENRMLEFLSDSKTSFWLFEWLENLSGSKTRFLGSTPSSCFAFKLMHVENTCEKRALCRNACFKHMLSKCKCMNQPRLNMN